MPADWNAERILSLAPDAASAKAGQGLGSARHWMNLGTGQGLVWGECQGSGSKPYQTKLDPNGPAFSCSCPSRKFPCKHGLGLMLLWAEGLSPFAEIEPPSWVLSWKENREKRAEVKEKTERGPAEPVAKKKRESARMTKVTAGLDQLSIWIGDLVRNGFLSLQTKSGAFWDEQARRMIDAQAPGVARRLRRIDGMTFAGEGWQTSLLEKLGQIHLLSEGFKRLETLPEDVAEDLRAAIGFTTDLDSVRASAGIRDHWRIIGQSSTLEDRLTVVRTWLIGRETGCEALVLDFIAGNRPGTVSLPPGFTLDAELAYCPGTFPQRALVKERFGEPSGIDALPGDSIAAALAKHGQALARNPWIERIVVVLEDVFLREHEGAWSVVDALEASLPLSKGFGRGWQLLGLTGGGPITLAGEFDGETLETLSGWSDGRFFLLTSAEPVQAQSLPTFPNLPILTEATASAVVGVDRKPPPKCEDDPIGRALLGLETREPSARLLAIAAATALYGRVGRKPALDRSPLPDPAPLYDMPVCPPAASARLLKMISGKHGEVLPEWLALLAKAGMRLPDLWIADMLRLGQQQTHLRPAILPVLGARGRWLAGLNRQWDYAASLGDEADAETVWQTGKPSERMSALKILRANDLSRARELLASTWPKETADDRAAFLDMLSLGLSMDDEPFLESALDDRGKPVRRKASRLLARLSESRLAKRAIDRAIPFLIGSNGLEIRPPTACTPEMVRDGIEPKPIAGIGEKAWWLQQALILVPPAEWSRRLSATPVSLIEQLDKSEWREEIIVAWSEAALVHDDSEWAWALLNARSGPTSWTATELDRKLFEAMPQMRREQYVLRRLPDALDWGQPVIGLLERCDFSWSETLGHEVLQALKRGVANAAENGATFALLETNTLFGRRIPITLLEDARTDWINGHLTPKNPELAARSWAPLMETLKFRHAMHEEFAR